MAADRPTLEDLLDDPAVSYPLKAVLLVWLGRDPVDAANDAAVLSAVMEDRAARVLEGRHGP
ncbi:hypothetical protein BZG35_17060 [Brevundimonas sp. LM2]|uniref:hypothetical protein n=1 Tax=Brevundimonas sp. LM2 TaxID=1938605 RepID=UPI000983D9D0|nr:hypothetical protein [Brevundimonas sp. LM2]AQR63165.1 hypothetical protein BZG35_17060 [Brevundimonas sp. LM2]